ncbi:MAG TPA: PQQ-binding-like beta-propeller repeat protein [Acidimicrobiia bacterium]|nr:PQQ-binding-like beta-propeller repeat protein [Acidimicrobiia bacterium]
MAGRTAKRALTCLVVAGALVSFSVPGPGASATRPPTKPIGRCGWPTWGQGNERRFAYPCPTHLSPQTAKDLKQLWFFNARDTVTATPAVVGGTVYVGDWSGNFYAIDLNTGRPRWTYQAHVHGTVYAGQIVSSAAVADVKGGRTVFFGGGKTLYALRADDGKLRWKHEVGRPGDDKDPSEIESSPVVADRMVIFGTDVHNSGAGEPAGVTALDAATGRQRWTAVTAPTEGDGATGPGCGDVWGSPSVDPASRLVFVGTGNCTSSPEGYGRFAEAIVALDLVSGAVRWTYQPHHPNRDDLDFAGAPNLFDAGGRALVGLGNKDATYYAVDRSTGDLAWRTQVTEPGIPRPDGNYSTGGFIGATAVADGVVVGGTAVGGTPSLHALDAATGAIKWQQPEAADTYASAAIVNGVVFLGSTTDFTFRAFDLQTGDVLWSKALRGGVAGGAAVVGDDVIAVAGIREPGVGNRNRNSGVYRFSLRGKPVASAPSTTKPPPPTPPNPQAAQQSCVASPCPLNFDLTKDRVADDTGTGTVQVSLDPFKVVVQADDLGDPNRWLRPGSAAQKAGATNFAVYLSQGTDNPTGGLLCELDAGDDCVATKLPGRRGATYDRISILAVKDPRKLPSLAEGFDRLVTTNGLDIPITPKAGRR